MKYLVVLALSAFGVSFASASSCCGSAAAAKVAAAPTEAACCSETAAKTAKAECCSADMACCAEGKACCAAGSKTACAEAACCTEGGDGLVGVYEKVALALAADDLAAARLASDKLACYATCKEDKALAAHVAMFARAASLEDARDAFKAVSASVVAKADGTADCYIMSCPKSGAEWVQSTKAVANPFLGKAAAGAGTVKKTSTTGI
ncbi:hypothetical protein ASA1KI_04090 [Opitutales bacterium ASA1]|uniref:hypothetical protein n=1 Tax=Congregicoccus parvus TaxID=3081749 RepID=UPI002B288227|nr:hypothetical protein ASA1KI_04090 [Opitutales bacterium ASA1]